MESLCKKLLLIEIVILIGTASLIAQPSILWEKTIGGSGTDVGLSVQPITGGYIIAGYTNSFGAGSYDVYLIKTNSSGDILWTKTFGGGSDDYGYSVQETSDGGYIVAGYTRSFGAGGEDIYLIKTNSSGDILWTKTFGTSGDERAYSVDELSEGGYIVAGYKVSGIWAKDYLIKIDADGNTLWEKTYGAGIMSWWKEVQVTDDGAYITAGFTAFWPDVYLAKTNSDGGTIWTKTIDLGDDEYGNSVQQTADNGYIIAGEAWTNDTQKWDFCLIKTDADGNVVWAKRYGGTGWDKAYSVKQTLLGDYIAAGVFNTYLGVPDVYLIKTDENGNIIWTTTYGGTDADSANSVHQTTDGGYIIAGASAGDVYLIKTEPDEIGIEEEKSSKVSFALHSEPNPFRDRVTIRWRIEDGRWKSEDISLRIYDATGRLVKEFILPTAYSSVPTAISWDGRDDSGRKASSGVYFLRFEAGDYQATKKILLVK
ncbi:hypothetical protein DRP53_10340 [candidate division WOR-3 bacterium]|uniref:Uncharacterized protein n=1 Tax=candidate division WOR-3 bacterium TaxID=2052148 RepID=A0A660SD76_UNCW3|nr:MAG: hypothetical protein DRP53_10340 [candidate division WOR-3 bacterium]